jgi:hypothetical protein
MWRERAVQAEIVMVGTLPIIFVALLVFLK